MLDNTKYGTYVFFAILPFGGGIFVWTLVPTLRIRRLKNWICTLEVQRIVSLLRTYAND